MNEDWTLAGDRLAAWTAYSLIEVARLETMPRVNVREVAEHRRSLAEYEAAQFD